MPESPNFFQKTIGEKLKSGNLETYQYARLKKFIEFDRLPEESDPIDYIVVLGTSKIGDSMSYTLRIDQTVQMHKKYPEAKIIISGAGSDPSRAMPGELDASYHEAVVMAGDLIGKGVDRDQLRYELEARNSKQNVHNSLNMIVEAEPHPEGVLFIGSSYMGRRVDLYIKKYFQRQDTTQNIFPTFIIDADVRMEEADPQMVETPRQKAALEYEWHRLAQYRKQGDL